MPQNVATLGLDVKYDNVDKAGKSLDKMGKEANKAEKETSNLSKAASSVGKGLKVATVAAAATAVAFAAIVRSSLTAVNELNNLSTRLGINVEELQTLNFAFAQTGVQSQTAALGLQRLQRRVAEAANGYGEAEQAIKELGIEAAELTKLPIDEQFRRVAAELFKFKGSADQTRLAMKLFDSEGVALNQTINQLGGDLSSTEERARELGIVLSREDVAAMKLADDAATELTAVMGGLADVFSVEVSKAILAMSEDIDGDLVKSMQAAIRTAVEFGAKVVIAFKVAASNIAFGVEAIAQSFAVLIDANIAVFNSISSLSTEPWEEFIAITKQAFQTRPLLNLSVELEKFDKAQKERTETYKALADQTTRNATQTEAEAEVAAERNLEYKKQIESEKELLDVKAAKEKSDAAAVKLLETQLLAISDFNKELAIQEENQERLIAAQTRGIQAYEEELLLIEAQQIVRTANLNLTAAETAAYEKRTLETLKQNAAIEATNTAMAEAADSATSLGKEFNDRVNPFLKDTQNIGGQLGDVLVNTFNGATDAMTEFLLTGTGNFRDFARSILADLARIAVQQAVVAFGFSLFGVGTPTGARQGAVFEGGSPTAFQQGGLIRSTSMFGMGNGQRGIAGENGSEAILPLSRTPGGELGVRSLGSSGGDTIINVNVDNPNNAADAEQNGQIIGQQIRRLIQRETTSEIKKQQRPGNILNRLSTI